MADPPETTPAINLTIVHPRNIAFSSRMLVATGSTGSIKIFDARTGSSLRKHPGHFGSTISSCTFSRDEHYFATTSSDKTCKIWNLDLHDSVCTLVGHGQSVQCCAFSSDNRFIATGSIDYTLKIWHVDNGMCAHTLQHGDGIVHGCAFSYDDRVVCGACYDNIKVWNSVDGTLIRTIEECATYISPRTISPRDYTFITTTMNSTTVTLLDVYTGIRRRAITCTWTPYCAFSADGFYIAIVRHRDYVVDMWCVQTNTCVHRFRMTVRDLSVAEASIMDAGFSCDGSRIAVCSYTATYIWDVPYQLRPQGTALLMVLVGNRCERLRLPAELWQWMKAEIFI